MGVVDYSGDVRVFKSNNDAGSFGGKTSAHTAENGGDVTDAGLPGCAAGSAAADGKAPLAAKPRASSPFGVPLDDVKLAFMQQLHQAGVMHFKLNESAPKADLMRAYQHIFEPRVVLQALPAGPWRFATVGDGADSCNGKRRPRKNHMRGPKCARRRLQQKKRHSAGLRGRQRGPKLARLQEQFSDADTDYESHCDNPARRTVSESMQNVFDDLSSDAYALDAEDKNAHSHTPNGFSLDAHRLSTRKRLDTHARTSVFDWGSLDSHPPALGADVCSLVDDRVMSMSSLLYQHKDILGRGEMSPPFRPVYKRGQSSPRKSPAKLSPERKRGSGFLQKLRRSVFKSKKFTHVKRPVARRSHPALPERLTSPSAGNTVSPVAVSQQEDVTSCISPSKLAVWCDNDIAVALNSDDESGWLENTYDCRGAYRAEPTDAVPELVTPEVTLNISRTGDVSILPDSNNTPTNVTCPRLLSSETTLDDDIDDTPPMEIVTNQQPTPVATDAHSLQYRDSPLSSSSDVISNWQWLELIPIADSTASTKQPCSDKDVSSLGESPTLLSRDVATAAPSTRRTKPRSHLVVSNMLQVIELPAVDSDVHLTLHDLLSRIENAQSGLTDNPVVHAASSVSRAKPSSQTTTNSCRRNRYILPKYCTTDISSNQQDETESSVCNTDHNESRIRSEAGTETSNSSQVADGQSLFFHPCQLPNTADDRKPRILIRLVSSASSANGDTTAKRKSFQCRLEGSASACTRVGSSRPTSRGRGIRKRKSTARIKMQRKATGKRQSSTSPKNTRRKSFAVVRKEVLADDETMQMGSPLTQEEQQHEDAPLSYSGDRLFDGFISAGDRDSSSQTLPSATQPDACDSCSETAIAENTQRRNSGKKQQKRLKKRRSKNDRSPAKGGAVKKRYTKKSAQHSTASVAKKQKTSARKGATPARKRKNVDGDVDTGSEQTVADGTGSSSSPSGKYNIECFHFVVFFHSLG